MSKLSLRRNLGLAVIGTLLGMVAVAPAAHAEGSGTPVITSIPDGGSVASGFVGPITIDFSQAAVGDYNVMVWCNTDAFHPAEAITYLGNGTQEDEVQSPVLDRAITGPESCELEVWSPESPDSRDSITFTVNAPPLSMDQANASVSPTSFYGYPDITTIHYLLGGQAADVTARVYNASGVVVRQAHIGRQNVGRHQWSWAGMRDDGSKVTQGRFLLRITAVADRSLTVGGYVNVLTRPLVMGNVYVSPTSFYGYPDTTAIHYHLSRAATITAWVTNSAGTTVRRVSLGTQPGGYRTWAWSGRTASGTLVRVGAYRIHIRADVDGLTRSGSDAVTLQTRPLVLGSAYASPATFYPRVHDGYRDSTTMHYHLNRAASVTARVLNSAGTTVRRVYLGTISGGYHTWAWGGRTNSGTMVAAGAYRIRITAVKDGLTRTVTSSVTVATGWHTKTVHLSRYGDDPTHIVYTPSCDYFYDLDSDSSLSLDCFGGYGEYERADYGFTIRSNATAINWGVNGYWASDDYPGEGSISKTGTRVSSTYYRVSARITEMRSVVITSAWLSYSYKYRV